MENWSPEQVEKALKAGEIILVDVREPGEYENERIPGALLLPLSTFDPAALPTGQGRKVVLHCAAGGRSGKALQACAAAGSEVITHMEGGMGAWKASGLAYYQIEPSTGQMVLKS
ncbi:rhodanese-like domain-containing protein [Oceanicaulis alexandrii]|uniref:rhodanese-like domain-containing protein n=1 Tax=Oceanicaulis TaxID=153232 RepID=UPI0035CED46C